MGVPSEIVPEELLHQSKKREYIDWLKQQVLPSSVKRDLLFWWAQWVGMRLQRKEFREVESSGTDALS